VVNIAYDPTFREAMDFFRGVLATNEKSGRVLALTKRVISLNAANYTAWHLRRLCLFELGKNLTDELEFVDECAENNPKNYQVWYHRRALVDRLNDGTREPQFVSQILSSTDSKNYHAWAHRQWALKRFQIWEGEVEYADYLIKDDVRNNSAWNHRWFVITRGGFVTKLDASTVQNELRYLKQKAELALSNECPYSYLRALVSKSTLKLSEDNVISWMESMLETATANVIHLRAIYVDALLEKGRKDEAIELCIQLAEQYDTIRNNYWKWRAASISTTRAS
jgi:protein farnesyltransferase/geranylgeranyltransferase type-1 subunit alpha